MWPKLQRYCWVHSRKKQGSSATITAIFCWQFTLYWQNKFLTLLVMHLHFKRFLACHSSTLFFNSFFKAEIFSVIFDYSQKLTGIAWNLSSKGTRDRGPKERPGISLWRGESHSPSWVKIRFGRTESPENTSSCLGGAVVRLGLVIERSLVRLPARVLSSQLGQLSLYGWG